MTRTEYMVRAALDVLPGTISIEERMTAAEERIERLERIAFEV